MSEPITNDIARLLLRLSNHVDANLEAIASFVDRHPETSEAFVQSLRMSATQLGDYAHRLSPGQVGHDAPTANDEQDVVEGKEDVNHR
jgi:hypothetical protein